MPTADDQGATRTALHPPAPSTDHGSGGDSATGAGARLPGATRIGDYEIIAELGEGGMGRVYRALDLKLPRTVAVKVLRVPDEFEASRFRGEAEITAQLDHPNITRIYEIGTADDRPYLVLEFAEGGSLDKELRDKVLEPRRAAEQTEVLARAVHYAHGRGVVHRDLKPANVLRAKDGTLKLTDFGLAKQYEVTSGLTPSGAVMGTPSYMAPEQAAGDVRAVGPAADVYGLGAILYEMLTGRPPFRGVNMVATLEQVRWADPAPPSRLVPRLPRDLGTICLKCLAKAPARRYATAGALADDLRRWLNGETIAARPAPSWERAWRNVRRRPWETAAVAAGVLVVVLVAAGLVVDGQRQREAADEHRRQVERDRAADEFRKAEAAHAARLRKEQDDNARRLQERGAKSRLALDAIRAHMTTGELKTTPGLHDLHGVLAEYYKQHIDEALADPNPDHAALARLAFEVGELAFKSGRLDAAEQLYRQARAGFAGLAAADPTARPRLGEAVVRVARVLYEQNRDAEARDACAEAEKLWTELEAAGADRRARDEAALQLAEVEHLRGELHRRRSDTPAARDAFTRAIEYRKRVAADFDALTPAQLKAAAPADRAWAVRCLRELGRGYGFRGDEYLSLGEVPDADRDYWDSHKVREKVFEALDDARTPAERAELEVARFQLGRSWMNLAAVQTRHRAFTTASQYAKEALKLREELVKASPNNAEYRIDLVTNLTKLGELTLRERRGEAKDRRAALDHLTRAAEGTIVEKSDGVFRGREALADARAVRAELLADSDAAPARAAAAADLRAVVEFLDDAQKRYPEHLGYRFRRVTMNALAADLAGAPPPDPRWAAVLDGLRQLLAGGQFRDEHPDDLRARPCFKPIRDDERFRALVAGGRP